MNNINIRQVTSSDVDIREFILSVWNKKVIIISLTLICALIAGLVSVFLLPTKYDVKLNIVINMPEKYTTRYGDYELPITTNRQYIDLVVSNNVITNTIKDLGLVNDPKTISTIKRSISFDSPVTSLKETEEQNSFEITISGETPEKAVKLAQTLFDNYKEFLDVMIKDRIVSNFYNAYTENIKMVEISLNSSKLLLEKNKQILMQVPQTINQKAAMNAIQEQIDNTKAFVVLENVINPNYTKVEEDIIKNQQEIDTYEDRLKVYKGYQEELNKDKKEIEQYYSNGKELELDSSLANIVESNIYLPSPPIAPDDKTSPSNVSNTLIGAVFGFVFAIIIVIVNKYWIGDKDK